MFLHPEPYSSSPDYGVIPVLLRKKAPTEDISEGVVVRNSDHRHDVKAGYLLELCGGLDSLPGSPAG